MNLLICVETWYFQLKKIYQRIKHCFRNGMFAISKTSLSVVKVLAKWFVCGQKNKTKALQVSHFNPGPCIHSFAFNSQKVITITCTYNEVE